MWFPFVVGCALYSAIDVTRIITIRHQPMTWACLGFLSFSMLQLRKVSSNRRKLDVLAMCTNCGDDFRLKLLSQEDGPQVQLTVN